MAGTRIINTDSRTLYLESGPVLPGEEGEATIAEISVLSDHLKVATPAPVPPPSKKEKVSK